MAALYTLPPELSTIILVLSNYYAGQELTSHQTHHGQGRTGSRQIDSAALRDSHPGTHTVTRVQHYAAIGLGEELRIDSDSLVAGDLCIDETRAHLAAFRKAV